MIRVMLADDHSIVRSGFRMILESDPEIEVVAEAADGNQAYNLAMREHPDVLLLDISMPPGQNGLVTCQNITHDCPQTKVIILTMYAEPEYLSFTMDNGASGYIVKSANADELKDAVHTVMAGEIYIHPSMREALEAFNENAGDDAPLKSLTSRELETLTLIAHGYTNKEISEKLFLSIKTVESYRAKIYTKLGLKNRADAVDYAIKHKLLAL